MERIGLVTSLSREHFRRILKAGGVSWQATTTWKIPNEQNPESYLAELCLGGALIWIKSREPTVIQTQNSP